MNALLGLAVMVVVAFSAVGLTWWLERRTQRPGLTVLIGGCVMLAAAVYLLANGFRLLPLIFVAQAVCFLYLAHWKHRTASAAPESR